MQFRRSTSVLARTEDAPRWSPVLVNSITDADSSGKSKSCDDTSIDSTVGREKCGFVTIRILAAVCDYLFMMIRLKELGV